MDKPLEIESVSPHTRDGELLGQIGNRIRAARTEHGLTQKALGTMAGVHEVHVSRLESGSLDTRISTLRKIADALGVTLADLVGR